MNEFLQSLSNRISEQIAALEAADRQDPDEAVAMRNAVQDRLQEIVIEINEKAEI